jgi:hypothetical protein
MSESTALHTAARRYCQERFSQWLQIYEELQRKENWQVQKLFEPDWDYSDEAYLTFPRYRIDKAIQVEVERLKVDPGTGFDELRARLLRACDVAEARLETELKKRIARKALHEEAENYRVYIRVLRPNDLSGIEPLPFRRVIDDWESNKIWNQLKEVWRIDGSYWFPLEKSPVPRNVLAFHTDYFRAMNGLALLRETLQSRGITRVFQLHEFGDPDYEIELGIFEPAYRDGGESYSTSAEPDWVVYASHESSITICGDWLIHVFRAEWPGCDERTYRGPFSTGDLRGTWDTKR